jgi:hypothetical protein
MLTRRQILQAILAAPVFSLTPVAPAAYVLKSSGQAPTITLPMLRPGHSLTVTVRNQDGSSWTKTYTGREKLC